MLKSVFVVLGLIVSSLLWGQYEDIRMEDYVYVTNVKSVSFSPNGETLNTAVTSLRNMSLYLSFDDLEGDIKDYTYDIIHCDRNWQPSQLQKIEYIEGFVNEEIDINLFSQGTFVPYTHYQLSLPNRDVDVLLSGNYVLAVYDGELGDEERYPVLTRRFVVVEPGVKVQTNARRPLDVSKIDTHQEFDLYIDNKDFPIIDPELYMQVSVTQNGNWNNSIDTLSPIFFVGNKITINNRDRISFLGLKEFRSLDIRSFDVISNDVQEVQLHDDGTDVLVKLGEPRLGAGYSNYPDANGAFVIDTRDDNNGTLQSDYATVIFSLRMEEELPEDVYVMGKFTDWQIDDTYKMSYDSYSGVYLAEILMKQGFYDYMFATERDGKLQPAAIEGSSFQAFNFYEIFVYLSEPGDRYDRCVGYSRVTPQY